MEIAYISTVFIGLPILLLVIRQASILFRTRRTINEINLIVETHQKDWEKPYIIKAIGKLTRFMVLSDHMSPVLVRESVDFLTITIAEAYNHSDLKFYLQKDLAGMKAEDSESYKFLMDLEPFYWSDDTKDCLDRNLKNLRLHELEYIRNLLFRYKGHHLGH